MKPLVVMNDVSKSYVQGNGSTQSVLNQAHLTLYHHQKMMLLGPSGSGKSTLLNLLAGIDRTDGGSICYQLENQPIIDFTGIDRDQRCAFRRRNIGFIFQFFNLVPTLTVEENVLLPLELNDLMHLKESALARLDQLGLAAKRSMFPEQLSGGEQQRVAIARALAHNPVLILADEPTGNLDQKTANQVMDLLIKQIQNSSSALVMVTHSLDIAQRADVCLELKQGKLVAH